MNQGLAPRAKWLEAWFWEMYLLNIDRPGQKIQWEI